MALDILELAKARLRLDRKTGLMYWTKPVASKKKLAGKLAGYPTDGGYWKIGLGGISVNRSRLVYALVHNRLPKGEIDHINGDTSDDRPENLREVTHQQNMFNIRRRKLRSLPIGVRVMKGKYQARLSVSGKIVHLGVFDTPDEASVIYEAARLRALKGAAP